MRERGRSAAIALALSVAVAPAVQAEAPDDEAARVVHALNRLGYGPRAGDVDRVREIGLSRWIEQQLHPETIRDQALEERLAPLSILRLSTKEILEAYEVPADVKRDIRKQRAALDGSDQEKRRATRSLVRQEAPGMEGPPRVVVEQLQGAKLIRAAHGLRQLDEVLVDFWMNHFNVFAGKGLDRQLIVSYERDVVRPRAWGRFEDLLKATAESPAMLVYLDNWLSTDPEAMRALKELLDRRPITPPLPRWQARAVKDQRDAYKDERRRYEEALARRSGINENYARELMELHTLGVDGGYTQDDVRAVARCFTGWTIRGQREQDPRFDFEKHFHARGDKMVLGRTIKEGGKDEGEEVLHLLATHPATARFISTKLARRFVADDPPAALVERASEVFRNTDGDIREVVRAIVTSPEFAAPETRGAKTKTPLEFVVSAVRAADGQVEDARPLARRVEEMGMPLYLQQPPTGYKDSADAWLSSGGLVERLNFAVDLAAGRVPGVRVAENADGRALGSPEFQRK
jgi:uncharacterized protein (DUF1800 family)